VDECQPLMDGPGNRVLGRVVGVKPQNLVIIVAGGDWRTQTETASVLFDAIGAQEVIRKAREGESDAQYAWGFMLVSDADAEAGADERYFGSSGRSTKANVGWLPGSEGESLVLPHTRGSVFLSFRAATKLPYRVTSLTSLTLPNYSCAGVKPGRRRARRS
jgi:hypothetical protein